MEFGLLPVLPCDGVQHRAGPAAVLPPVWCVPCAGMGTADWHALLWQWSGCVCALTADPQARTLSRHQRHPPSRQSQSTRCSHGPSRQRCPPRSLTAATCAARCERACPPSYLAFTALCHPMVISPIPADAVDGLHCVFFAAPTAACVMRLLNCARSSSSRLPRPTTPWSRCSWL